ncbi:MAG: YlmC/YmxH family sporulation protein [Firmicutes bacterium]|nr:YlmC/YmxH family sporulation protein [Bacillota bacterium]
MAHEEMGFCELRNKEIVNEVDGRRLGRTCDLIFSPKGGAVLGIVAPFNKRGMFFKGQEVFIPFKHITKIGPDVILVRLTAELSQPEGCVNMGKGERPSKFEARRAAARGESERGGDRREYYEDDMKMRGESSEADDRAFEDSVPPDCDFKCEKCMLFDCGKRWKGGVRGKKRKPSEDEVAVDR